MVPVPLQINPVSKWRRGFLLLIFLLAEITCIACISMQALWVIGLLAILPIILIFYWRQPEPVQGLIAQASGEIELQNRQGERQFMQLLPSTVVTPLLIILHLKGTGRRQSVVLWPDSASAESLRQWRVWLRWIWPSLQARSKKAD